MKQRSLVSRKVQLAFAFAILALLAVGTMAFREMSLSGDSEAWVQHTPVVLANLQELLSAMEAAESSYRGFVLTGEQSYINSYHASIVTAAQAETMVRHLTADNPVQQLRLPALEKLIAQ